MAEKTKPRKIMREHNHTGLVYATTPVGAYTFIVVSRQQITINLELFY